jgi:outer membrane receptor protein involved in Fe transport
MLFLLSLLFTLSHAPAQQLAPRPEEVGQKAKSQEAEEEDTTFVLSPFEVSATKTVGYQANDTLAGTRIKSDLKDIANSVQVVTKEFLEDTGATNLGELLIYTTSTEVAGPTGNSSFGGLQNNTENGEIARREPQLSTRVRGLAAVDLARDYFISDVAFDSYNSSEVTINRGPNASLFGLGSPGGILNQAMDRAETNRTIGEVHLKMDEFGTFRASLNYNQPLVKDKLAVRVAYLDSNQRYEQKQAKYNDERYYLAATWRPMKSMAIRANYEKGEGTGNRPILRPPTDRITPWFQNGKPLYNPLTQQWFINGALVTNATHISQLVAVSGVMGTLGVNGEPAIIFDDPNRSTPGNSGYDVMQIGLKATAAGRSRTSLPVAGDVFMRSFNGERTLYPRDPAYIIGARPDIPNHHLSYYSDPQLTDLSVFNPRKSILNGPNSVHSQDFEIYSVRAEKTFLNNNLGFELAYQNQFWKGDLIEPQTASSAANLTVDINTVLLDGTPNPNVGRPMVGGRGYALARIRERESYQAISFLKHDFAAKHKGWLRYLGRHALTAVYQHQTNEETAPNRTNAIADNTYKTAIALGGPGLTQADADAASPRVNNNTRVALLQYIGLSMLGSGSLQDAQIQGVTARQTIQGTSDAMFWNPYTGRFEKGKSINIYNAVDNPSEVWIFGNSLRADKIESFSAVLQSHFLNDHLVTTASWRKDAVKNYAGLQSSDPVTGLFIEGTDIPYGVPILEEQVEQSSYGIVGHLPKRFLPKGSSLSFHYVNSSNFAAGAAAKTIYNEPAPLQSGKTEEYGFSVSALGGKLYTRVNWYESRQDWAQISPNVHFFADLEKVLENNTQDSLRAAGFNPFDNSVIDSRILAGVNFRPSDPNVPWHQANWTYDPPAGTAVKYFQTTLSRGKEIETTYAPSGNWRIALNVSQAESQVADVMPVAGPALTKVAKDVFLHPVFGNFFITPNPIRNPNGSYQNDSLLRSRADNLLNGIAEKKAPEGGPLQEIREWRVNLVTNYAFKGSNWRDTLLSGFSVGAGIRWEDAVAIGGALKEVAGADSPLAIPDQDALYYGPTETNVDGWITYDTSLSNKMKLQLQLRVRNLTAGDGDFIPIKANPDGQIALWRFGAPRYFEFSARIRF